MVYIIPVRGKTVHSIDSHIPIDTAGPVPKSGPEVTVVDEAVETGEETPVEPTPSVTPAAPVKEKEKSVKRKGDTSAAAGFKKPRPKPSGGAGGLERALQ